MSLSVTTGYTQRNIQSSYHNNSSSLCFHLSVSVDCEANTKTRRFFSSQRVGQGKPPTGATSEFIVPLPSALPTCLYNHSAYTTFQTASDTLLQYLKRYISREKVIHPIPSVRSTPGDRNQTLLGGPDRNEARKLLCNPSRRPTTLHGRGSTTLGQQGPFALPPLFRLPFDQSIVLLRSSLHS